MAAKTAKTRTKKPLRTRRLDHKQDGIMGEFLNQITRAGYLVALNFGFRGSFVRFLSELQTALEEVIRQDRKKQSAAHL